MRAPAASIIARAAGRLWLERLSRMTTSPGFRVGTRTCVTWASNHSPLIGPSMTSGATVPVLRKPATSVVVLRWPCGKPIRRRSRFLQHPCVRAMFVAVQVSSMKASVLREFRSPLRGPGRKSPWRSCRFRQRLMLAALTPNRSAASRWGAPSETAQAREHADRQKGLSTDPPTSIGR